MIFRERCFEYQGSFLYRDQGEAFLRLNLIILKVKYSFFEFWRTFCDQAQAQDQDQDFAHCFNFRRLLFSLSSTFVKKPKSRNTHNFTKNQPQPLNQNRTNRKISAKNITFYSTKKHPHSHSLTNSITPITLNIYITIL